MTGPLTELTDADAVTAVRSGDVRAFDTLVERYFTMVSMIGYARLGCRETAEDLAQEVFLRAYLNLDHLDPPALFAPWLTQIARNLAIDWLKQKRRSSQLISMIPVETLTPEQTVKRTDGVSARMENQEQHQVIHDAIQQLNPLQREIVLLHYVEQSSNKEIAKRLAMHPGNVGRQLKKALKMMRRTFEPTVRGSAAGLRPQPSPVARTLALIAAAAILPTSAKAALFASATVTGTIPASCTGGMPVTARLIGWLKAAPATLTTRGSALILAKAIALVALSGMLVAGSNRIFSGRTNAPNSPVHLAAQHAPAARSVSSSPPKLQEAAMTTGEPKPSQPAHREQPIPNVEKSQASAEPAKLLASAETGTKSVAAPEPELSATTQPLKPEPDFDLILLVANAHRQNLQGIKTWQGKARIDHQYYETDKVAPDTKSKSRSVVDVSFSLDRDKKTLASRWLDSDPNPLFSNVLLTADELYRYRGRKSGKPPPQLVIYPRSKAANASPELGDTFGFDPTWYMEKPLFNKLDEELLTLRANAANPTKARPWEIPDGATRTGDRVVVEQTKGRSTWRYTFDLSQGGNLVTYAAGSTNNPLELAIAYEKHDGVWIVKSYRRVSIDKPFGDHPGQTTIDVVTLSLTSLNQPLSDTAFAPADLGATDSDIVEDRRGQIVILNGADTTRVPAGQEFRLTQGPKEWAEYVREKIVSAYPPLDDDEEAQIRAILDEILPEAAKYEREHEAEFSRLRAECAKVVGLERPRDSQEATELVEAVKDLNKRWTDLESTISVTLFERLRSRVEAIVKTAEEQRRPMHDAEIAKITPKMMETIRSTQSRVFDIARSCYVYAEHHQGGFPADLDELAKAGNTKPEKLVNPRRPQDKCGYTYIKPARDEENLNQNAVLAFEVYDQWPQHGIAVAVADGHAEWIADELQFNRMLKATLMPDTGRSGSASQAGEPRSPLLLLPDGRLSRSASAVSSIEDEWGRFVQEFIVSYELDPGQQETANSILRGLRGEAIQYRTARREQFEELDIRLSQLSAVSLGNPGQGQSFKRSLLDLREQRRVLEHPLDDMFNRLKDRLQTIPTQAQRQAVAAKKKAGRKPK